MARPDARDFNGTPEYFRDLVESTPYTQDELGRRLGCTARAIRMWMTGKRQYPYAIQFALECLVLEPE